MRWHPKQRHGVIPLAPLDLRMSLLFRVPLGGLNPMSDMNLRMSLLSAISGFF